MEKLQVTLTREFEVNFLVLGIAMNSRNLNGINKKLIRRHRSHDLITKMKIVNFGHSVCCVLGTRFLYIIISRKNVSLLKRKMTRF